MPEVETVVRGLRRVILNQTIANIHLNAPKIDADNPRGWLNRLKGQTVVAIRRRGKNILIDLTDRYTLWVHLRMTGQFHYVPRNHSRDKHDLMEFSLLGNGHVLRFRDYRRFGRVRLRHTDEIMQEEGLADLGPEPLEISAGEFVHLCRKSSRMIKPALLDQSFIAGLGNIYTDEMLFAAGVHPRRLTDRISRKKLVAMHGAMQAMLKRSITMMGTTVDTYTGVNGRTGRFQKYLRVYGRDGEPCPNCGTMIRREKVGSRSAHFCPKCQRLW
ncbi:MAG: DNA-formamidopyrimidine glycosylase [candidate division Zixibacteria bacterium]|nr:DNA-formamidopyrimidine glycosylase [candidate division Zixibacteria bacterium]